MTNYLDADHWRVAQIADELMASATELRTMQFINQFNPTFSKDGNQFCYLYGTLPNDCVVGFGETAWQAALDFHSNFVSNKAH